MIEFHTKDYILKVELPAVGSWLYNVNAYSKTDKIFFPVVFIVERNGEVVAGSAAELFRVVAGMSLEQLENLRSTIAQNVPIA